MNIRYFLDKINRDEFLDESDLNELKKINEIQLLSIFQKISDNHDGAIYLLKCYMTVMDPEVLELTYQDNQSIVELGLSKLWKDEIRYSKEDDIIEAYIPINLFSTKLISYFRKGIDKYYNQGIFEFDSFIHSLIISLTDKKDFVISKLLFNNLEYENKNLIENVKNDDQELSEKLTNVYDNLMVASTLINFAHINNESEIKRYKKIIKKELRENYVHVDMDIISGFFSYDLLESINSDFRITKKCFFKEFNKKIKNKKAERVSGFNNRVNYESTNSNIEEDLNIEDIGFSAKEPDEEPYICDEIRVDTNTENSDEIGFNNDDKVLSENKKNTLSKSRNIFLKKSKKNRFKDSYYKKDSGLKIIIISLLIILASAFSVFKIISSEIERENRIYDVEMEMDETGIDVSLNIIKSDN